MKTFVGFALGTVLSFGTVTSAAAAAAVVATPARMPVDIEVIVVTAKRLAQPIGAAQPIDEFIVVARRAATVAARTPPAVALAMPAAELAFEKPPVVRL